MLAEIKNGCTFVAYLTTNKMATIKKQSKSMSYQNDKVNDIEKARTALANGAIIVTDNRGGYAVEYPQGGYFKITNSVYKKLA